MVEASVAVAAELAAVEALAPTEIQVLLTEVPVRFVAALLAEASGPKERPEAPVLAFAADRLQRKERPEAARTQAEPAH